MSVNYLYAELGCSIFMEKMSLPAIILALFLLVCIFISFFFSYLSSKKNKSAYVSPVTVTPENWSYFLLSLEL